MSDQPIQPTKPPVLTPKPDPMQSLAPAHALRPVEDRPSSGIEVGPPQYREDFFGSHLNHRLYVPDDPTKNFRFCSGTGPKAAIRKQQGFEAVKDATGKAVVVGNLQLCSRPIEYQEAHDRRLEEMTNRQSRRVSAETVASENSGAFGTERIQRNVPAKL